MSFQGHQEFGQLLIPAQVVSVTAFRALHFWEIAAVLTVWTYRPRLAGPHLAIDERMNVCQIA